LVIALKLTASASGGGGFTFHRTEFEYQMIDGMSVVIPDMNKIRNKLEETIGS